MNIEAWIRQPSTLHGLGVLAAGVGVALAHLATGNPTIDGIAAVASYALVHLGIDDNSAAERSMTTFTTDLMHGQPLTAIGADATNVAVNAPGAFVPPASPSPGG